MTMHSAVHFWGLSRANEDRCLAGATRRGFAVLYVLRGRHETNAAGRRCMCCILTVVRRQAGGGVRASSRARTRVTTERVAHTAGGAAARS